MNRRDFSKSLLACATATATATSMPALAQGDRPMRLLVGFPPGGSADTIARLVAEQMRQSMGRTVIVENRAGAAGRLAPEFVRQAAADGDTLMVVPHGPMTLFPHIYSKLRFDPQQDFTPIARLVSYDYAWYAANSVHARNAAELKAWLARDKRNATYGSPGAGSVPHFMGVSIAQAMKVPMVHVPYRGGAPALADVAGGVLPFAFTTLADGASLVAGGRLKVLATGGQARSDFLRDVPTLRQFGVDIELGGWFALYGPKGLPASKVETLNRATVAAVLAAPLQERWKTLGLRADPSSSGELAQLQRQESARWPAIVAASGFTPED